MKTIQAKVQVRRTAGILVAKGRGRYVFNNRSGVTGVSVAASMAWKCARNSIELSQIPNSARSREENGPL